MQEDRPLRNVHERRRSAVIAGHEGDLTTVRSLLADPDAVVRAAAWGALDRLDAVDDDALAAVLRDDDAPEVRRRAIELAATRPGIDLAGVLDHVDPTVVEQAAWAAGEQEHVSDEVLRRLIALATGADDPMVREAAVAALGAIGEDAGLPAVLAGLSDRATVRRRAVIALAAFEGDQVEDALRAALDDRDWQVRQVAEDLLAEGTPEASGPEGSGPGSGDERSDGDPPQRPLSG